MGADNTFGETNFNPDKMTQQQTGQTPSGDRESTDRIAAYIYNLIDTVEVNKGNLQWIADRGKVNGSLRNEIYRIMKELVSAYADKLAKCEVALHEINTHLGLSPTCGWALTVNGIEGLKSKIEQKEGADKFIYAKQCDDLTVQIKSLQAFADEQGKVMKQLLYSLEILTERYGHLGASKEVIERATSLSNTKENKTYENRMDKR